MPPKSKREANRELKDEMIEEVNYEANHELTHELTKETILDLIRKAESEILKEVDHEATRELSHVSTQEPKRESCVPDPNAYDLWPQFDAYIKAVIAESAKQYAVQHKLNGIYVKGNGLANKDDY